MKYECLFANPKNMNENRSIFVDLKDDEILLCENPIQVQALALHHAYRTAPANLQHVRGCIMPVVN
jgi:hypothetical protein